MVVIAFSRTLVMTVHLSLGHSAICWQLESWVFPRKNPTCNKSQDTATVIGVTNGSFFQAKHKAVTLLFTNTRKRADQMLGVLNHLSELWCFGDVRLHNSIYQRDIELHAAIFCLSSGSEVELDRLSRALGHRPSNPYPIILTEKPLRKGFVADWHIGLRLQVIQLIKSSS